MNEPRESGREVRSPHAMDLAPLAEALEAPSEGGLSSEAAAARLERDGPNELASRPPPPAWKRFLRQFREAVVVLLLVAAAVSAAMGDWIDAAAILAIVLLNAALGFLQEERAARAIESLRQMSLPRARVVRDGAAASVPAKEVVVGDRVLVEAGDQAPADLRLVDSVALRAQEAVLTGESVPVEKDAKAMLEERTPLAERRNSVFMGTTIVAGRGEGLAVATGMRTQLGAIAAMLEGAEPRPTPLQQRLSMLGRVLAIACVVIVALVGALLLRTGAPAAEVFVLSIGLAVAAAPEGLPAVVTIALALGMRRLAERNALVRTLPSVETLGSVTVICTDKTGTLTRNEMVVRELVTTSGVYRLVDAEGDQRGGIEPIEDGGADGKIELERALAIGVRCNNARWSSTSGGEGRTPIGDPTETALLSAAARAGVDDHRPDDEPVVFELPFDSERKRMSVATRRDGRVVTHVKGAAEIVIERCTHRLRGEEVEALGAEERSELAARANAMAERALRVLAFAQREGDVTPEDAESDLVFVGLVGMKDPPRPEAREAVETCRRAGIRPVMITGDHPRTAIAIARELGIAAEDSEPVLGEHLENWDDAELRERVESIAVFARTTAEHKLRIVRALRHHRHVVAMTGDGVNDAPALQEADIGVAMGRSGSDVSREASDLVLVDDNFASIVAAVREGRGIFDNIRKFVHFLLTANAAEIAVIATAVALGWPTPLNTIQLLWINLVTDGLPALALGVEPAEPDVMEREPRGRSAAVISRRSGAMILVRGALLAAATLAAYSMALEDPDATQRKAMAIALATLVFSQLACVFAFRSRRETQLELGFRSNLPLIGAVAAAALLQLVVHLAPPLRELFELDPLEWGDAGAIALWSLAPATVIEVLKLARRPFTRRGE